MTDPPKRKEGAKLRHFCGRRLLLSSRIMTLAPLATLLLTWAAIFAFVGSFFFQLQLRIRSRPEYMVFGVTCFGMTIWSLGSAATVVAKSIPVAIIAAKIQLFGGLLTTACFVEFAALLSGMISARWVRISYSTLGVCALCILFGPVFTDDALPAPQWTLIPTDRRIFPTLSWLGILCTGLTAVGCIGAIAALLRARKRAPELLLFALSSSIGLIAGLHDLALRIWRIDSIYLLEHYGIIPVVAVTAVFLFRVVRASNALRQQTHALHQSHAELRSAQEQLVRREQLAAVGELSAVIAHEVRNPLAIIKNAASSLRRTTLQLTDRNVLLDILDEEVDRLNRLVRDLLSYARPLEPRGDPIDLPNLLQIAIEDARAALPEKDDITISTSTTDCPTIQGDAELLRQALRNVIANALQSITDKGAITIRAATTQSPTESEVAIEIQDNGEGMDPQALQKAKDPFFTQRPSGTGLGLAIVDRVIRNHGGALVLESQKDRGTLARITLPHPKEDSEPSREAP